jgi:hypothetical protein
MRTTWQATAVGIALGVAGAGDASGSPVEPRPSIEILVLNQANVPASVIREAQKKAGLIYAGAGIDVVWMEPGSGGRAVSGQVRLVVSVTAIAPNEKPAVLGYASRSEHTGGSISFAFFSRVTEFARVHRADLSQVLAYVIAHEIGHLLLSHDSHSRSGIMRAVWKRADIAPAKRDLMRFSDEQAESIREMLTVATAK